MKFDAMLERAVSFHGHACVGLVLGTRIAIAGLHRMGLTDTSEKRDIIVYVELDRCLADAIQAITGCTIGKRRLKHVDYGKFAATFVNMLDNKGTRISLKEKSRELAMRYGEEHGLLNKEIAISQKQERETMIEAYSRLPDADLLEIKDVTVSISELDLPGPPQRKVTCATCGERIFDGREKMRNGKILCKPCADGAYYRCLEKTLEE